MKKLPPFQFDKVHKVCCCRECVHERLLRLFEDLDGKFAPEVPAKKEVVQ